MHLLTINLKHTIEVLCGIILNQEHCFVSISMTPSIRQRFYNPLQLPSAADVICERSHINN